MIAGAALATSLRPVRGFGLGQTELKEQTTDAAFREWASSIQEAMTKRGQVVFPTASGNWGTITHVMFSGRDRHVVLPLDGFEVKNVYPGEVVTVDIYANDIDKLGANFQVGLCRGSYNDRGPTGLEEVTGNGYKRVTFLEEQDA